MSKVALQRLKKELDMLYREPPPGISAWAKEDNFFEIEAGALSLWAPCVWHVRRGDGGTFHLPGLPPRHRSDSWGR
eukprot:scaffold11075_cov132-Isochrysis_galbana.AAC.8